MKHRRQFIKLILGFFTSIWVLFDPLAEGVRIVFARVKKIILPKGTRVETLISKNPAGLDTHKLELTPLEEFGTMGLSDHRVDLNTWQFILNGRVQHPLKLTYSQIIQMPSIEKNVLLICPGVFAYHAHWKGISVVKLLEMARLSSEATYVTFSGPKGTYEKTERFPIEDILSDRVFLAYGVNDNVLPKKHGFPLRVVAEGYYGSDWIKYVYKVTVDRP